MFKLDVYLTYENLNKKILSPDLFTKINFLNIEGVVDGIQGELFKDFHYLKNIRIALSNFKVFFNNGNQWMKYLNLDFKPLNLSLDFRHLNEQVSFDSVYEYPDEDLCLFKDFPHDRFVYPKLVPGKILECSCTIFWLELYLHHYEADIRVISDYNLNYQEPKFSEPKNVYLFCNKLFNINECNLTARIKMCKSFNDSNIALHKLSFNNDFDIFYVVKLAEFFLLVIMRPIFCFFGIVHNVLIKVVISNQDRKKDFQKFMYNHIRINAIFNIIYCTIVILKLINTCVFYGPSVFCSSVYQEVWAQNFKIILIHFLGNVTKLCSNFSYLMFSISRLLLITNNNDNNLPRKRENNFLYIYVFFLILISCFLSLFKLFQYGINLNIDIFKEFPLEVRDETFCRLEDNKLQCSLFNIFKISYRFLNDILFLICNIIVDLVLLKIFKKHLARKLTQIIDLEKHKTIEKSKKSLNRMIFFNSLIYILSHLPKFTMTVLLIVYADKISNFCNNKLSCDLLNEEAEFFNLISVVCQFYVFKMFDKNFKASLNEMLQRLRYFLVPKKKDEVLNLGDLELNNLKNLIGNGVID